jgi:hypothetical protein
MGVVMKKLVVLGIIVSIFFISPYLFADQIKIEERTVIPIRLIQTLKGDTAMVGESVDFEVATDIIIDDFIVIKRGAPAYGTVTSSKDAGYVSQGGQIGLSIDYCKAIDGKKVYLKSILQKESESHVGANVAASVLLCPLILLAKGEAAEIPLGTEFRAYAENDVYVEVDPSAKLTPAQREQIEQKEKAERERLEKERMEKEKEKEPQTPEQFQSTI